MGIATMHGSVWIVAALLPVTAGAWWGESTPGQGEGRQSGAGGYGLEEIGYASVSQRIGDANVQYTVRKGIETLRVVGTLPVEFDEESLLRGFRQMVLQSTAGEISKNQGNLNRI